MVAPYEEYKTIKEIVDGRHPLHYSDDDYLRLVNDYKSLMFKLIDRTREDLKEFGFPICWDKESNSIFRDKITSGKHYAKTRSGELKMIDCKENQIGSFHTHGYRFHPLSSEDIEHSLFRNELLTCIGSQGHGRMQDEIRCYELQYDVENIYNFSEFRGSIFEKKVVEKVVRPLFTIRRGGQIEHTAPLV